MRALVWRGDRQLSFEEVPEPTVEILAEGDLELGWLSSAALGDRAQAFANLVERPGEYTKIILSSR